MIKATERTYQAYLLRLWRDGTNEPWRASLQSTKENNTRCFADVKSLITFLEAQTSETEQAVTIAPVAPTPMAPQPRPAPPACGWTTLSALALNNAAPRPQSVRKQTIGAGWQAQLEKFSLGWQGWNRPRVLVGGLIALLLLVLLLPINTIDPSHLLGTALEERPVAPSAAPPSLQVTSSVMAWGDNRVGQLNLPANSHELIAVAAGDQHSLGLTAAGAVIAWGETKSPPADLQEVVALAAGRYHNLALKRDGSVVAWGDNLYGQVPVPVGLRDVTAIVATEYHNLALKGDGTVVAWGNNSFGNLAVPADLDNVVAIAASVYHSLALRRDGTVVAWGDNRTGGLNVPDDLVEVTAIAAGEHQNLALRRDGTVVDWGSPSRMALPTDLTDITAIAAGYDQLVALPADGRVIIWNGQGSTRLAVPAELTSVRAVAVGAYHLLALR